MDAHKIFQLSCLKNIIDNFFNKLITTKCKLNNEKKIKKILLKIIKKNISVQDYSFTFLLKTKFKNINVYWEALNKKLHLNISSICNPDNTSLEIIDTYLKSEFVSQEIFNKIYCLINKKPKTSNLKNIFTYVPINHQEYVDVANVDAGFTLVFESASLVATNAGQVDALGSDVDIAYNIGTVGVSEIATGVEIMIGEVDLLGRVSILGDVFNVSNGAPDFSFNVTAVAFVC